MKTNDLQELQRRFPTLQFDIEQNLPRVRFEKDGTVIEVFLHGAHVSHFEAANGSSPLFMSANSAYEQGKALRGGVPICFPWFGPKKDDADAPAHGFARTMNWELSEVTDEALTLRLQSNEQTLAQWPHDFRAQYRVGLAGERLHLAFEVHNIGKNAFDFEVALHSYFRVSDCKSVSIEGLEGKTYLDKVDEGVQRTQNGPVVFEAETDRVYLDSGGPITLHDGERTLQINELDGWRSTIVWNPWIEKARRLKDLGDDEWPQFVCIESGAVGEESITLEAGNLYRLAIEIEVKSSL